MIQIIPAVLTNDSDKLKEMFARLENVCSTSPGLIDRVQIDIIDGVYADNKTVEPDVLVDIDTNFKLDFHLMVKEPVNWVEKCVNAGANRIIGQIEMMSDQVEFVGKVQEVGALIGLAIDLDTPTSKLDPVILNNLDVVLVMSVRAGFGGQEFDPSIFEKLDKLDEIRVRDDTPFRICVDGGIAPGNIRDLKRGLVDEVAMGRRLFKGSIDDNIKRYQKTYK